MHSIRYWLSIYEFHPDTGVTDKLAPVSPKIGGRMKEHNPIEVANQAIRWVKSNH